MLAERPWSRHRASVFAAGVRTCVKEQDSDRSRDSKVVLRTCSMNEKVDRGDLHALPLLRLSPGAVARTTGVQVLPRASLACFQCRVDLVRGTHKHRPTHARSNASAGIASSTSNNQAIGKVRVQAYFHSGSRSSGAQCCHMRMGKKVTNTNARYMKYVAQLRNATPDKISELRKKKDIHVCLHLRPHHHTYRCSQNLKTLFVQHETTVCAQGKVTRSFPITLQ